MRKKQKIVDKNNELRLTTNKHQFENHRKIKNINLNKMTSIMTKHQLENEYKIKNKNLNDISLPLDECKPENEYPIKKTLKKEALQILDLVELCKKNFYWDSSIVKNFFLIMWVQIFLNHKLGNFIATKDIFVEYKNFFDLQNCSDAILPESSFYKEIYPALLAAKIIHTKARKDGKRGINGIQFNFKRVD